MSFTYRVDPQLTPRFPRSRVRLWTVPYELSRGEKEARGLSGTDRGILREGWGRDLSRYEGPARLRGRRSLGRDRRKGEIESLRSLTRSGLRVTVEKGRGDWETPGLCPLRFRSSGVDGYSYPERCTGRVPNPNSVRTRSRGGTYTRLSSEWCVNNT